MGQFPHLPIGWNLTFEINFVILLLDITSAVKNHIQIWPSLWKSNATLDSTTSCWSPQVSYCRLWFWWYFSCHETAQIETAMVIFIITSFRVHFKYYEKWWSGAWNDLIPYNGTNRNVLFQTHLLFVTIYGLMWSSFNTRWCWTFGMCHWLRDITLW